MRTVLHVELKESMRKLLEDQQFCLLRRVLTMLMRFLLNFLSESAAIIMEGIFASNEHSCWRVVRKDFGRSVHRTDEIVRLWLVFWVFEV